MSETAVKTERLTEMLAAENLGAVLLNAQHNFSWLTGGKSNGVNSSIENGACFLLVRSDGKKYVLANNIEMPRLLAEEIAAHEFEPVEFAWEEEKSSGNFVFDKAKSLLETNLELASDLFLSPKIKTVENLIARCRYQLTSIEIERYRKLGNDAGIAIGDLFENINVGETELEIAGKIKTALAKFNIISVVTLVGADDRIEKFRHPVPTSNVWQKVLLAAVCAKREGLIVNLSRLVCAGKIPRELQNKTEAAARINAQILAATQFGKSGAELYRTAQNAYAAEKYADEIFKHHQGGACGYKTRDWVAHPQSAEIVQLKQAFAWNPTITGTKIEETILLNDGVTEVITESPNFPKISVEIEGCNYSCAGILGL